MKKRILAVLLSAVLALSLSACGGDENQPSVTKLSEYKDFESILTGEYEVTDEKVAAYFSNVVYSAGIGVMEVKDRDTVQAGDIVYTDYTGYLNGEAFSGGSTLGSDGSSNPTWIDVSNNCGINADSGESTGSFIDGFTDGLIGAKIGQKTSSEVTFPEKYGNADLAGKLTTFEFDVKAIYVEVTPDTITDAMVEETFKESYEVTTVADFMEIMEKELAYNLLINNVIANSEFDIPDEYLELRLEEYQNLFTELYCNNMDLETYLAQYYGVTLDTIRAEWKTALKSQIQAEVVFEAIVKEENIKINKDALTNYVATVMTTAGNIEGNDFFAKEENIHKMLGVGNAEAGKTYFLNQNAVRDWVIENYK